MATVVPDVAPDHAVALAERALADLGPDDVAFRGMAGMSQGEPRSRWASSTGPNGPSRRSRRPRGRPAWSRAA